MDSINLLSQNPNSFGWNEEGGKKAPTEQAEGENALKKRFGATSHHFQDLTSDHWWNVIMFISSSQNSFYVHNVSEGNTEFFTRL